MTELYRIVRFYSLNGSKTADKLSSMKHPKIGKLMLFTSYQKAHEFIKKSNWGGVTGKTYPDEFYGKVTKRYIIDPDLEGNQNNLSYLEFKYQKALEGK